MSMPQAEIEIILSQLRDMRKELRYDVECLHAKIDTLTANGCAKASVHAATSADHEARMRLMERYVNRQAGQVALIGGGSGILTALLVAIGRVLLTRIGSPN